MFSQKPRPELGTTFDQLEAWFGPQPGEKMATWRSPGGLLWEPLVLVRCLLFSMNRHTYRTALLAIRRLGGGGADRRDRKLEIHAHGYSCACLCVSTPAPRGNAFREAWRTKVLSFSLPGLFPGGQPLRFRPGRPCWPLHALCVAGPLLIRNENPKK